MTDKTELERLEKNVVDTYAAAAWTAYRKAKLELEDYLKEKDNDHIRKIHSRWG